MSKPNSEATTPTVPRLHTRWILALAGGMNWSFQSIFAREVGSTMFATEIVVVLTALAALLGPFVGLAVFPKLRERTITIWRNFSLVLYVSVPWSMRLLITLLNVHGHRALIVLVVLLLLAMVVSAYCAIILPKTTTDVNSLPTNYRWELIGALLVILTIAVGSHTVLLIVYYGFAALFLVLTAGAGRQRWLAALLPLVLLASYAPINRQVTQYYYRRYHQHLSSQIVLTRYSPLQRIDVVDDPTGRSLYLDGIPYFRGSSLTWFDLALVAVPLQVLPQHARVLVVGSGSFFTASMLQQAGHQVTVVEIDAAVAAVGMQYFAPIHHLAPDSVTVVIADIRNYLQQHDTRWDAIILDVPAPFHVRTALLHTREFYELVRSRLLPNGVCVASLAEPVDGSVARMIARALLETFPETVAIDPVEVGFAVMIASPGRAFSLATLQSAMRPFRADLLDVYRRTYLQRLTANTEPLRTNKLFPALTLAWAMTVE